MCRILQYVIDGFCLLMWCVVFIKLNIGRKSLKKIISLSGLIVFTCQLLAQKFLDRVFFMKNNKICMPTSSICILKQHFHQVLLMN